MNPQNRKEYHRAYYLANREKAIRVAKDRYAKNKAHVLEQHKEYRAKNKVAMREKARHYVSKRKKDINYKLRSNLRTRLYHAIKNNVKRASAVKDLGCSVEELKSYLESQFETGMTWDNWTVNGWHIDHIFPLSLIDPQDPFALKRVCHYTNLRPVWAKLNISKGNKSVEG